MALRKRSAFAVYQQLKAEEDMEEVKESQHSSESSVEVKEGSRKRKREQIVKKKKKQRVADGSDEDLVESKSQTKKSRKAKERAERMKKLGKQVKSGKREAGDRAAKKKNTILTTHRNAGRKVESTSGSELSLDNGFINRKGDDVMAENEQVDGDEISVHIPFCFQFKPDQFEDSRDAATDLFRLVINPVSTEQFFGEIWERKPLVVHRHQKDYNSGWFSTQELDTILRENDLEFGTNIDITTYVDGERQTHSPEGRAHASTVWEFFQGGCSVRLLNPATYSQSVWLLNSTLQEHFNSCVGANIYLTPADTQGFAPHYDDIEAFVLQLEGRKHWRVYAPKTTQDMLPLSSSGNFSEDDDLGPVVIDTILEPGDLLYFPRGFIHQASTLPESHSLHITVSTYQNNTWGTVIEKLLPSVLKTAMVEDVDFRRGLPLDCTHYMGIVNSDKDDPRRIQFCEKISELMAKLIDYAPVDTAVDEVATDDIHNSLPPVLTQNEKQNSVVGQGIRWIGSDVQDGGVLTPDTNVRLIRFGSVRLVIEDGETTLYYTLENSKIYHEKELIGMQIHENDAPAMDYLINAYPKYVAICELPIEDGSDEDKVSLCHNLYSQGLLMTELHSE